MTSRYNRGPPTLHLSQELCRTYSLLVQVDVRIDQRVVEDALVIFDSASGDKALLVNLRDSGLSGKEELEKSISASEEKLVNAKHRIQEF